MKVISEYFSIFSSNAVLQSVKIAKFSIHDFSTKISGKQLYSPAGNWFHEIFLKWEKHSEWMASCRSEADQKGSSERKWVSQQLPAVSWPTLMMYILFMTKIMSISEFYQWFINWISQEYTYTVWKCQNFSIPQILREINFWNSRSTKPVIFPH